MSDIVLRTRLSEMGIDMSASGVLALLPLVEVAWAEGSVQEGERKRIFAVAEAWGIKGEDAVLVLEDWLRFPPSNDYVHRGTELMLSLIRQGHRGLDASIPDRLLEEATSVAKAAGGFFFGWFNAISAEEQEVLNKLAHRLDRWRQEGGGEVVAPVRRPKARMTMFGEDEDYGMVGILVHEAGERTKHRVTDEGLLAGSSLHCEVEMIGLAPEHFRVWSHRRRFFVEAIHVRDAITVNGERVGKRRLFGGETIQAGEHTFSFKMATPS